MRFRVSVVLLLSVVSFPPPTAAKIVINQFAKQKPLEPKEIPQAIQRFAEKDPQVVMSVQHALVETGPDTIPYLADAIEHNSNPAVRGYSIDTLGRIKEKSSVPILVKAIHNEKDARVQGTAFNALDEFDDAGLEALIALSNDLDKNIRLQAVRLIAIQAKSSYMDAIIQHQPYEKGAAKDPKSARILSALSNAVGDSDLSVRLTAVSGLGEYPKDPAAIKALQKASLDKNVRVRLAAQQLLDPEARPIMAETFFGARSTKDTGPVDFSKATSSFELKQVIQSELNKYTGDGKIELSEAKYGPGASTFGYQITLPDFEPDLSSMVTYKLTGLPVWDQRGLAKTARFLLQTLIPGTTDWSNLPEDIVIITPKMNYIQARLTDTAVHNILIEKSTDVAKLPAISVSPEVQPLAPIRVLFDVDLPVVVGHASPILTIRYDVKKQPVKRKMRVVISANPPPG